MAIPRLTPLIVLALLAGCTSTSHSSPAISVATINGTLEAVGGPAPGSPRPLPGNVTAAGRGHRYTASVGSTGAYTITLPVGTYTLTGRSPLYQSGTLDCQAEDPVAVTSGGTVTANVYCQER